MTRIYESKDVSYMAVTDLSCYVLEERKTEGARLVRLVIIDG